MNQLLQRVLGSDTFVSSRTRFSNFSSALGPIFNFLSMSGHNFSFVHSRTIKMENCVRSRVPKMKFCVLSRSLAGISGVS